MPVHSEKRISKYSSKQLFDLIIDVEKYPEFLPWCSKAKITKIINSYEFEADLEISFKTFLHKYKSHVKISEHEDGNAYQKIYEVSVKMINGPFDYLVNNWKFIPQDNSQTEIIFFIDFRLKSKILEKFLGFLFDSAFSKMANSFENRAKQIYG